MQLRSTSLAVALGWIVNALPAHAGDASLTSSDWHSILARPGLPSRPPAGFFKKKDRLQLPLRKAVAPEPPAPKFPFSYLGRAQKPGEPVTVYLGREGRVFSARVGQILEGEYRIEEIGNDYLKIQFLTQARNSLIALSSIGPQPAIPSGSLIQQQATNRTQSSDITIPDATITASSDRAKVYQASSSSSAAVPRLDLAQAPGGVIPGANTQNSSNDGTLSSPAANAETLNVRAGGGMVIAPPPSGPPPISVPTVKSMPLTPVPNGTMRVLPRPSGPVPITPAPSGNMVLSPTPAS